MRKLRPTLHGRLRHESAAGEDADGETEFVEIDTRELSGLFAAPAWLRDLGVMAWLLVGVTALVAATVWLLSLTQTIVIPVVTAAILASVLAPLVRMLKRHKVPRGVGAAIVLLLVVIAGALIAVLVLGGISAESGNLNAQLQSAANKIESTLKDLGVSSQTASQAKSDASSSTGRRSGAGSSATSACRGRSRGRSARARSARCAATSPA